VLPFLRRRRRELDAWLTQRGLTHTFCLASYLVQSGVRNHLAACAPGRVVDAGSGRGPHRAVLTEHGCDVLSLDVEDRGEGVDLIGDIQSMPDIASGSVDGVVCTQVLEHLPRPCEALSEFARVLRPRGWLVLSVPHLSAIHEAPHDYFRYTRYGLVSMLEAQGFEALRVEETGGLIAFLGHAASAVWLALGASVPGFRRLAWAANYLLLVRLLAPADRWLGLPSLYPCNYVVTARRATARPRPGETTG